MKVFNKLLNVIVILIIITIVALDFSLKSISNAPTITPTGMVKAGVLIYNDSVFSFEIAKDLKNIQKENENKIEFTLFDANSNSALESEFLMNMLDQDYDFILANISGQLVPELIEDSVNKAKQKNIPLIFFDISPTKIDVIKSYPKSMIVINDSKQAGTLQGKMIVDAWNSNKAVIDKNRDNILQYIMIKGEAGSSPAEERTKYSIKAINDAGIKTQELASVNANWDKKLAEIVVDSLFLKYNGKIEVIIANNDTMAIGAVEALQKYGYNTGDKTKNVQVFGINALPEAQELIKKGFMAGSIPRNSRAFAEILYTAGMNMVQNKYPLEGINYNFDETGVTVVIPFE